MSQRRTVTRRLTLRGLLVLSAFVAVGAQAQPARAGVVVERVPRVSAGEQAGLLPGDVLLSWERVDGSDGERRHGVLDSPFDVALLETEDAPRGSVILAGLRGGERKTWTLAPGPRGLAVRPAMSESLLILHAQARALDAAEKYAEAAERWRAAADEAATARAGAVRVWLLSQAAHAWAEVRAWAACDAAYADAVAAAESSAASDAAAHVLRDWGEIYRDRAEWDRADDCFRRALAGDSRADGGSLVAALDLRQLGNLLIARGQRRPGKDLVEQAVRIEERLAPDSLELADSLEILAAADHGSDLGQQKAAYERILALRQAWGRDGLDAARAMHKLATVLVQMGEHALAEAHARRALHIQEGLGSEGSPLAETLNGLGLVLLARGELLAAELTARRALDIATRHAPDSLVAVGCLWTCAMIARERGDLAVADEHLRRALRLVERLRPDSARVASILFALGGIAERRGDLSAADNYTRRSLALCERDVGQGICVTASLQALGSNAADQGRYAEAAALLRRTLTIQAAQSPESSWLAYTLDNLGRVLRSQGDLAGAQEHYERALAMRRRLGPRGLEVARSLLGLAYTHIDANDWAAAEQRLAEAQPIAERLAPGSQYISQILHARGLVARHAGRGHDARVLLCGAVDGLDQQLQTLGGGSDVGAFFIARYSDYDHECIASLLEQGLPAAALQALERSRARSLRKLLAERDLLMDADVPADIAQERRRIHTDYDRTQAELSGVDPTRDGESVDRLLDRLHELREQHSQLEARMRNASPRFASLHSAQALDLEGVGQALDPGSALLAYSVGPERTLLFVVERRGADTQAALGVHVIPIGASELRERVERFRRAVQQHDAGVLSGVRRQAAELYELLVTPAEDAIAASTRLLLSPDGPLHTLPFAALVGGRPQAYLVERKPLELVSSATVFAELKKTRRPRGSTTPRLVAFGDPKYPAVLQRDAERIGNLELRSALAHGRDFAPLPSTRREVQGIARLFSERAEVFLGDQAREERVKSLGTDVRYLHFATHGLLDEHLPLNSALVLTTPENPAEGEDNGLLQAWEVFESVRLDADLVTLSACDTALGKEMGGEGLVGLTRAFQYAGARSVLASLWGVADESTAVLMKRFYRYLRKGRSKDEALRAAQRDLLGGRYAHPFYWAAFQLNGDWQ